MQVYDTLRGPALLVRTEKRSSGVVEYLFAVVVDRKLSTFWRADVPQEFQLINDQGGRADADVFQLENGALVREKAVLLECLAAALGMLDERSVEAVRGIYRTKMKDADLISLTRPSDLVGTTGG